jgi:hypothetical protein
VVLYFVIIAYPQCFMASCDQQHDVPVAVFFATSRLIVLGSILIYSDDSDALI